MTTDHERLTEQEVREIALVLEQGIDKWWRRYCKAKGTEYLDAPLEYILWDEHGEWRDKKNLTDAKGKEAQRNTAVRDLRRAPQPTKPPKPKRTQRTANLLSVAAVPEDDPLRAFLASSHQVFGGGV